MIHERRGRWARQLRARMAGLGIEWSEARSTGDLVVSVRLSACPIVLLDLGDRPARVVEDLSAVLRASPAALTLVLDPGSDPEVGPIAREFGATLVLPGVVVAPQVVAILRRWLPIARERAATAGWTRPTESHRDSLDWPASPTKDTA